MDNSRANKKSLWQAMTTDERIDLILAKLHGMPGNYYIFDSLETDWTSDEIREIVELMDYYDLAKVDGVLFGTYNYPLKITQNGRGIQLNGGWLKKKKSDKQSERAGSIKNFFRDLLLPTIAIIVSIASAYFTYRQAQIAEKSTESTIDSLKVLQIKYNKLDSLIKQVSKATISRPITSQKNLKQ